MKEFDYGASMERLMMLAGLLADSVDEIEECVQTVDAADSIGPILDPTAWIKGSSNLQDAKAVLHPLLKCAKTVAKARAEMKAVPR